MSTFRLRLVTLTIGLLTLAGLRLAGAEEFIPDAPAITVVTPLSASRGGTVDVTLQGTKLAGTRQILCRYTCSPDLIAPAPAGVAAQVLSESATEVKARLTIAADAPSGLHQLRAVTAEGVTIPAYFFVSQYAESAEKEPNNSAGEANPVTLPTTIAGVIGNGEDRDTYSFEAKRGDMLAFDVDGLHRFSPPQNNGEQYFYLDSLLTLQDSSGRELAYDDDSSRLDSVLVYRFPADGKYYVTVRDSLYRGRPDFNYRLTIGRRPVVTAVYPPGGQAGTRLVAVVYGYNLDPSGATSLNQAITLPGRPGAQEYRLRTADGESNPLPVVAGNLLEMTESEPNNGISNATQVVPPITASGKFDNADDVDGYRFQGQLGQTIVAQVTAAKLGSPADTQLTLVRATGEVVARDDDGGGMPDARLQARLPASEDYVIFVRDVTRSGGGPRNAYRLTIRALQPGFDFAVKLPGKNRQGGAVMVPVDNVPVKQGASTEIQVDLARHDEQSGEVTFSLSVPPSVKGLSLDSTAIVKAGQPNPAVIKNGQNTAKFKVSAAAQAPVGTQFSVFLRANGLSGAQPYELEKPLWVTVVPK